MSRVNFDQFLCFVFSICVLIPCSKEVPCCSTSFLPTRNSATCLVLIKWATLRVRLIDVVHLPDIVRTIFN